MSRRLLTGFALAAVLAGCGQPAEAPEEPAATSYEMRGVVRRLPQEGVRGSQLLIHHESVPGFVDIRGEVVGMDAMTMPFDPAPGQDLSALAVGDKIAFRLEVDWRQTPAAVVSEIRKLPEEIELEF